jgi:hypothetical protein
MLLLRRVPTVPNLRDWGRSVRRNIFIAAVGDNKQESNLAASNWRRAIGSEQKNSWAFLVGCRKVDASREHFLQAIDFKLQTIHSIHVQFIALSRSQIGKNGLLLLIRIAGLLLC